jgi:hypothetical protein
MATGTVKWFNPTKGYGLTGRAAAPQKTSSPDRAEAASFPDDDLLGRIDAVDLDHVLGDIQTDSW